MLKYALKKEQFNFMEGWMTLKSTLCDKEPGVNLLLRLLGETNKEHVINEIIYKFGEDDSNGN